jgi:hypothetical protein
VHYFSDFPAVAPFLQELYRKSTLGNIFLHGAVTLTAAGGWKKKEGEPIGSPWLV